MKNALIILGVLALFVLIFLNPAKQDTPTTRNAPSRVPFYEPQKLINANPSQALATNGSNQGASPAPLNSGPMPEFNPPHGQPWHRCEIAVGAPLNPNPSSGKTNQLATTTSQTANPVTANNKARPKLNPPHGEPFHRCEIPVGAPLDSEPKTSITQPTSSSPTNTQPQEIIKPILQQPEGRTVAEPNNATTQNTQNVGEKPALNPPHGQPWHRCEIKVGDPLP
jgi:hypothetical protein